MPNVATAPFVTHSDLVDFADDHVNLHRDEVASKRTQVDALRTRLETKIDADPTYALIKMLHAGSVAKGTALSSVSDMDVAVYVRATAAPQADKELVPWLVERLREVYAGVATSVSADTHCAVVQLSSGLKVDVVPVLYEGEPHDIGYLVSKRTGRRIKTSIPRHIDFIRRRKDASPIHYAQVVRFVKWWGREKNEVDPKFRCKSFLVELLVAHLADRGAELSLYPEALETVFAYICRSGFSERIVFADYYSPDRLPSRGELPMVVLDPVTADNNVAGRYEDSDRQRLVDAADDAVSAIAEARFATTKDRAVRCWQRVLGPSFRGSR